jgi:hypothetical protein
MALPKQPPHLEIRGWFLSFTDEELAIVKEAFEENGYELDATGMKSFILDTIDDAGANNDSPISAVDGLVNKVAAIVKENPETIKAYASIAGNMFNGWVRKKSGRVAGATK